MQQFTRPISKSQSTNVYAETGLHRSTVGISSQRALSKPQTLRRVKQYILQDHKIHAPKKNQNTNVFRLNNNRAMEMPVTTQSPLRTMAWAIKPKLTAFQMLIRQCCRTGRQIPSLTQNTPCRQSKNSVSFPLSLSLSDSHSLILLQFPYDFHLSGLWAK